MEFLKDNLVNTTTAIAVGSNTNTVENLFLRDEAYQCVTQNFNNDLTTASITLTLAAATTISRIGLLGHNLKSFTIFYDGLTANTFALTSTAATTTTNFTSNSETAHYFMFSTQTVSSVTIDMKSTIEADNEKAIGFWHVSDTKLIFDRIPAANNYKPVYQPKEIVHKLSDGSRRVNYIQKKFEAQISFKYIEKSFRDSLYSLWQEKTPYTFVPFGTSSGWDGILHKVVWTGPFDFYKYSDNAVNAGFSGKLKLYETSDD